VARGPKLIMEMRQPHSTMTTGVRQPIKPLALEGNEMAMCPESVLIRANSKPGLRMADGPRGTGNPEVPVLRGAAFM